MLGCDFEIQYKPGLENKAADALSIMSSGPYLGVMTTPSLLDVELIRTEVRNDPQLTKILAELIQDPDSHPKYR